jgi:prephenate dehydrogenase
VLAIPVDAILDTIAYVLDRIREGAVLVDFGSTKEPVCRAVAAHPKRGRFVAAHPIAGTEHSGPRAAFASLLRRNVMILCERERSDVDAIDLIEVLCGDLEMPVHVMDPAEHDLHLAYVSHLSHISSFALGLTVLEKEKDETTIFHMAGSGFSSTARLAKSSPQMWAPIFGQNRRNISAALDHYIRMLQHFREIIDAGDDREATELMTRANEIRRILDRIDGA